VWEIVQRYSQIAHRSSSVTIQSMGIEPGEIHGPGIVPQRLLTRQIEVVFVIRHHQFTQRTIDRLAKTQPGVIGFGDGSPMAVFLKIASRWSSSRTVSRSRINAECPLTRSAAAARKAPSAQCATRSRNTRRGERQVASLL